MDNWQLLKSEKGENLTIAQLRFDYLINPRNGKTVRVVVLESGDAANVVALTKEGKMLLVRQYRFGLGCKTIELPGGIIDEGEAPALAAKRELREETGYTGHDWVALGRVPANPVFQDSWVYHLCVRNVEKTTTTAQDEAEDIELLEVSVDEAKRMLRDGEINHPHSISCLVQFFKVWNE